MIEEQVVVTSISAQGAWVEGIQQSACNSCSAKTGCGQHTMSQLGRSVTIWLPFSDINEEHSHADLQVGSQVVVGLPEGAILRSTLVLYGIPLIALVFGAVSGNALWGEVGSIFTAVITMVLGFKLAGFISERNKRQWQPQLLRNCSQAVKQVDRSSLIHSSK